VTTTKTSAQNMPEICPKPLTTAQESCNSHWFEKVNGRQGSTRFVYLFKKTFTPSYHFPQGAEHLDDQLVFIQCF